MRHNIIVDRPESVTKCSSSNKGPICRPRTLVALWAMRIMFSSRPLTLRAGYSPSSVYALF